MTDKYFWQLLLMISLFLQTPPTFAKYDLSVSFHKAELMMFGTDHLEIELVSLKNRKVRLSISDRDRKVQPLDLFKLEVILSKSVYRGDLKTGKHLKLTSLNSSKGKVTFTIPNGLDLDLSLMELQICLKRDTHQKVAKCESADFQPFTVSSLTHHHEEYNSQ